ncbi:response regulator transcription factor [Microscilla marina]|uniref:Transcriptional regulator, LuxR family protein n=1 Tax=Microscilla marina ATCC 23134 TaxID=313606 RepID=A1ZG55_MICM2|nr:helix-turn-helix transcriptional regulator [Microscilla marina]EAY30472.1 transcriptional regulator, LuxR family protein [Microscilla marina ATCC 23134]
MKKIVTEKEIIATLERQAFLIEQKLKAQQMTIEEANTLTKEDNYAVNLYSYKEFTLEYLGKNFEKKLNVSTETVANDPTLFIKNGVYPGDFEKGVRLVQDFVLKGKSIGYIQRVKPVGSGNYLPLYTLINGQSYKKSLVSVLISLEKVGQVTNKMLRILEETLYMRNNYYKFAALTPREKEIITLLALGYQNNEIGEQLFISKATVEQYRKNLKRKLEVRRFVDLIRFAQAFDLI